MAESKIHSFEPAKHTSAGDTLTQALANIDRADLDSFVLIYTNKSDKQRRISWQATPTHLALYGAELLQFAANGHPAETPAKDDEGKPGE